MYDDVMFNNRQGGVSNKDLADEIAKIEENEI
jgi:hypothetical protein